jgi:hypothetical protein
MGDPITFSGLIPSERHLAGLARLLAGCDSLTAVERRVPHAAVRELSPEVIAAARASIERGEDPLGSAFCALRSAAERRSAGAVYTPPAIVRSMVAWAASQGEPTRIVDPGAGSGRYIRAAAKQFPQAALIAVELDPLAALLLRANLAVCGLADRTQVIVGDYRSIQLPDIRGVTLFIGNPPYVRHHDLGATWKNWFAESALKLGIKASKLAGLHIHFFFKTMELSKLGDIGCFITSAEWLDVNYGGALRRLLADHLGGCALHVLDPRAIPFADVATTGAITCFRVGRRPDEFRMRSVADVGQLNGLSDGAPVPWERLDRARSWSSILRPTAAPPAHYVELGALCRVSRGQVTGSNGVWIAGAEAKELPESVLMPTVTKARELIAAGDALWDASSLRRVVNLPMDLGEIDSQHRKAVARFLAWAKAKGAADGYVAQHRGAWWSVRLYEPAPIMCTYMARRAPAFVLNLCGARHINIAHGLYPRQTLSPNQIAGLLKFLRERTSVDSGRTYAGGLTKFEPREIERLWVPDLPELAEIGAKT